MDSSAAESVRMVGLNGADLLALPIMGDHRTSLWHPGSPRLDEERWRSIHRVRAMDNQLCMVVARSMSRGSCVIDRSGEVLVCNDGTHDVVAADVARDDGYRKWNGGCFRQVNWPQRRPHLYGARLPAPRPAQPQGFSDA
jgi:predicted amidohydrolase